MEDLFDDGKIVKIETEYGIGVKLYMRYLKVKELPEFFRIAVISDVSKRIAYYINMIESKVDEPIDYLSSDALFTVFENMNFSQPEDQGYGGEQGEIDNVKNFDITFDFLISQGHRFSDILEYTVPRYRYLLEAASNRVFGKKKKPDPLAFFSKMGIPVELAQ